MEFAPQVGNPAHPPFKLHSYVTRDKIYVPQGFDHWIFFVHNEGFNFQHIIEGNFDGKSWTEAATFIQRWAYWGMIEEVLKIGGMEGPSFNTNPSEGTLRTFSANLPLILMVWQCIQTDLEDPEAEKKEFIRFLQISTILTRVNSLCTLLCSQEAVMWESKRQGSSGGRKATHVYAKHSHPLNCDDDSNWDDDALVPTGGKSFFSEEPHVHGSPFDSPGHALFLSIALAGELLSRATELKYNRKLGLKWQIPLTLVRRLHLAGWCPMWGRKLHEEGSVIRAYYLSSIARNPVRKHIHCCTFGCTADQVSKPSYTPKHRIPGCNCRKVSFDLRNRADIAEWIQAGHTPLVVGTRDKVRDVTVWKLIRSYDMDTNRPRKYVAMSHVWADGTGSENGNNLLQCQLETFLHGARQLCENIGWSGGDNEDEYVPIWVDTICVPYDVGPLKMQAIRQMERVYRDAFAVLVFDKGLQQVSLSSPTNECLTHIEISSWNQRLWTIQEAAFAKSLHFQFKDGITSIPYLFARYRANRFARLSAIRDEFDFLRSIGTFIFKKVLDVHLSLAEDENVFAAPPGEMERQGIELDPVFQGTAMAVEGLVCTLQLPPVDSSNTQAKWSSLCKLLPYRQTSIVSDEGLCVSTLLGMDLDGLYTLTDEERVQKMFLHIRIIDSSILFGNRPRMNKPGFRWMPSTFVSQRFEPSLNIGKVSEDGLSVRLSGIFIGFPSKDLVSKKRPGGIEVNFGFFHFDDEDGKGVYVCPSFPLTIMGTNQLFLVDILIPAGMGAIQAMGSKLVILIKEDLVIEELPDPLSRNVYNIVSHESKQLKRKAIKEGFIVQDGGQRNGSWAYGVPVTLSIFDNPTPAQLATAARGMPMEEREWLIS
jgi:hypothetical protein